MIAESKEITIGMAFLLPSLVHNKALAESPKPGSVPEGIRPGQAGSHKYIVRWSKCPVMLLL